MHLEESITKLRGEFDEHIKHLQTQLNEVEDKVISLQEANRKEADREAQIRGRLARVDDWMNDLQEQVNKLNTNMAEVQASTEKTARYTRNAETQIGTLSRRVQEVHERVGIAGRADPEQHVEELEKRIDEQDQVIGSLKEELQRVLATLGHIVVSGTLHKSPGLS